MIDKKYKVWHKVTESKFPGFWDDDIFLRPDGSIFSFDFLGNIAEENLDFYELVYPISINDKYDKEMYEGDLIKLYPNIYIIEFWLGSFCLTLRDKQSVDHFTFSDFSHREIENMEIIGNIYENKDLLNGSF